MVKKIKIKIAPPSDHKRVSDAEIQNLLDAADGYLKVKYFLNLGRKRYPSCLFLALIGKTLDQWCYLFWFCEPRCSVNQVILCDFYSKFNSEITSHFLMVIFCG